jgi:hypothetical protein
MEAGNHNNLMLLKLENYPVGEAPHSRPSPVTVDDWETQRVFGDCLDCQRKLLTERRAHIVVPGSRFFHVRVRFRQPYGQQLHGFLNRPALTCSHGITSEGFCSCRAIR